MIRPGYIGAITNSFESIPSWFKDKCLMMFDDRQAAGGEIPNLLDGGVTHMTYTGSGLSRKYYCPDNATYKAADTDYAFFKTTGAVSECDGTRLVSYDFSRIIVFYLNASPYTIKYVALLKLGETLTTIQMNRIRVLFNLSIWWSGTLSAYGNLKGNRASAKSVWIPESVAPDVPTGLTLILISGGVQVDWTDTNGGTAETEIYAKIDSGAYALVTTEAVGVITYDDIRAAETLMTYKIRALKGGNYSAYTTEVSIAMLGAELIDDPFFNLQTSNKLYTYNSKGFTPYGSGYIYRTDYLSSTEIFYALFYGSGIYSIATRSQTAGKTYVAKIKYKCNFVTTIGFMGFDVAGDYRYVAGNPDENWHILKETTTIDGNHQLYCASSNFNAGEYMEIEYISFKEVLNP